MFRYLTLFSASVLAAERLHPTGSGCRCGSRSDDGNDGDDEEEEMDDFLNSNDRNSIHIVQ